MTQKNKSDNQTMPNEIWYQDADGEDFIHRESPEGNYIDNVLPDNIKHYFREDLVIPKSKVEGLIKTWKDDVKQGHQTITMQLALDELQALLEDE
ncbi:MAG TPA: hypothetical protein VLB82_07485 [Thermodesulfobacteriota bacterium]|nr:hypothetical protein [Thermodesulfobacteriota bacterium]